MPIKTPISKCSARARAFDFVSCLKFVFRPRRVDAYFHQVIGEQAITTVHFQGYTQEIPDPEQVLYGYLSRRLQPEPSDEDC
jgi:hypothetical protein